MAVVLEYMMCREKLGDQNQTFPRSSQRQAERQQAQAETLHYSQEKLFQHMGGQTLEPSCGGLSIHTH